MKLPLPSVVVCAHFNLSGGLSNILSLFVRNVTEGGDYQAHFFKCANTPVRNNMFYDYNIYLCTK